MYKNALSDIITYLITLKLIIFSSGFIFLTKKGFQPFVIFYVLRDVGVKQYYAVLLAREFFVLCVSYVNLTALTRVIESNQTLSFYRSHNTLTKNFVKIILLSQAQSELRKLEIPYLFQYLKLDDFSKKNE